MHVCLLRTKGTQDHAVLWEVAQRDYSSLPAGPLLRGTPQTSGAHPTAGEEEEMLCCRSRARCHRNTAHSERTFMPLLPSPPASQPCCVTPLGAASLSKKSTYGHTVKQNDLLGLIPVLYMNVSSVPGAEGGQRALLSTGCAQFLSPTREVSVAFHPPYPPRCSSNDTLNTLGSCGTQLCQLSC